MHIFQRLFFAAVLAGLAASLAMSAAQQWRVIPLILEAETYEDAAPAPHDHHDAAEATAAHSHDAEAWAPADGVERTAYTVLANLLGGLGFALLLGAAAVICNLPLTARNGVIWGVAGFVTFQLAPAIGLPPELPGMAAAELGARQVWWWGTVVATGGALLILARWRHAAGLAAAALLLLAPHLIGAPQAPHAPSAVPAHLATSFAATTLATGALFWLILGPLLGWLFERFGRVHTPVSAGASA